MNNPLHPQNISSVKYRTRTCMW